MCARVVCVSLYIHRSTWTSICHLGVSSLSTQVVALITNTISACLSLLNEEDCGHRGYHSFFLTENAIEFVFL